MAHEAVRELRSMGFSDEQAQVALSSCDGDLGRAISLLLDQAQPVELEAPARQPRGGGTRGTIGSLSASSGFQAGSSNRRAFMGSSHCWELATGSRKCGGGHSSGHVSGGASLPEPPVGALTPPVCVRHVRAQAAEEETLSVQLDRRMRALEHKLEGQLVSQ